MLASAIVTACFAVIVNVSFPGSATTPVTTPERLSSRSDLGSSGSTVNSTKPGDCGCRYTSVCPTSAERAFVGYCSSRVGCVARARNPTSLIHTSRPL